MIKVLIVAIWTAALALSQPSAREILDRYVQVTGGAAAYHKVQNENLRGEITYEGRDDKVEMTSLTTRAGQQVVNLNLPSGNEMHGISNGLAWEDTSFSGPRILDGREKQYFLRQQALFYSALPVPDAAELAGTEQIGDANCYKLVLRTKDFEPETRWYDQNTGLLTRMIEYGVRNGKPCPLEITFGDYRKSGDLLIPFLVTLKQEGQTARVQIQKAIYNDNLPPAAFEPPATVRKLADAVRRGTALPNAKIILERAEEASGDLEKQRLVKSQMWRGKMSIPAAGLTGAMTLYTGTSGEMYQVLEMPGAGKVEIGNNGDVEWERSTLTGPKVRRVANEPGALLHSNTTMGSPLLASYSKVETVGVEDVDGKACYKVDQWPRGRAPKQTIWYAQDTGLPVQMKMAAESATIQLTFSDYRPVDGLKLPFILETEAMGQKIRIAIDEIKLNEPFPKEALELPDDIAKLVKKRTAPEIKELQADPDRPTLQRKKKPGY